MAIAEIRTVCTAAPEPVSAAPVTDRPPLPARDGLVAVRIPDETKLFIGLDSDPWNAEEIDDVRVIYLPPSDAILVLTNPRNGLLWVKANPGLLRVLGR
jgi:hypothetical protein